MKLASQLLLLGFAAILAIQVAFASPCTPFPGAWTGEPASDESLADWVGFVYDHNSGCDSPVIGATFNLRTSHNDSEIQIYIAERRDINLTVGEPKLLFDGQVITGDGTFQNVSFEGMDMSTDAPFVLQSGAQYLVIIKSSTGEDEVVGVDSESGYAMWKVSQAGVPGDDDIWTSSSNTKARVWFHLMPACYGILADQPSVCGGNGQCIGFDECACNTGYEEPFCNATQGTSSSESTQSSQSSQSSQNSVIDDEPDNTVVIVLSIVGSIIVIFVILIVVIVVIVAIVVGVVYYYQQHRYPLPRTYSRPFAEMPGKETEFDPMAI